VLQLAAARKELTSARADADGARGEAGRVRAHLETAMARLSSAARDEANTVDKRLVRKLLLTHLDPSSPASARPALLHVMSGILGLSEEEKARIGLAGKPRGGWGFLPALRWPAAPPAAPLPAASASSEGTTLTDLWVDFLLKETAAGGASSEPTSPKPAPALPPPATLQSTRADTPSLAALLAPPAAGAAAPLEPRPP
jgi:hypothetical protein